MSQVELRPDDLQRLINVEQAVTELKVTQAEQTVLLKGIAEDIKAKYQDRKKWVSAVTGAIAAGLVLGLFKLLGLIG
jgi:hypothetical protein